LLLAFREVTLSKPLLLLALGVAAVLTPVLPASAQPQRRPFAWQLPGGFPRPRVPDDNPMSWEKIELGRFLFYDTRLSGNQTQACAGCHQQEQAFTDSLEVGVGSTGELHPRNSMSLTNVAYGSTLSWANPLLMSLEQQALIPMFGEQPIELGLAGLEEVLLERLAADARYQRMFAEAFAGAEPISVGNIVKAIASFQRTLISGNSPLDRYALGLDDDAISAAAIRGIDLFFGEKFECFHCHGGFNRSDHVMSANSPFIEAPFHNDQLYNIDGDGAYPPGNTGTHEITHEPDDMGRFKAPTLRNIELTAPYMHDGSIATLEEVLAHYAAGGRKIEEGPYAGDGSQVPERLKSGFIRGFEMSKREEEDMLALLRSMTDIDFVTNPRFSDPFVGSTCPGDCDFSGGITVDELVTGINMALGDATLAWCVGFDRSGEGQVSVDELVASIRIALSGCPVAE
jgi:cytochrome c peroxidase